MSSKSKSKGTPYTVRVEYSGGSEKYTVHVPDDFDRARGIDDTARDLAAVKLADVGWRWRSLADRISGEIYGPKGEHQWAAMRVAPARISRSGCPIEAGERAHTIDTYRVVRVNDRAFNEKPGKPYRTIRAALRAISTVADESEHWRVVEIPAGEPWDYDGIVVAAIQIERGCE